MQGTPPKALILGKLSLQQPKQAAGHHAGCFGCCNDSFPKISAFGGVPCIFAIQTVVMPSTRKAGSVGLAAPLGLSSSATGFRFEDRTVHCALALAVRGMKKNPRSCASACTSAASRTLNV